MKGVWFGCISLERESEYDSMAFERHNYFWSGFGTRAEKEAGAENLMVQEFPPERGWTEVSRAAYRIDDAAVRAAARLLGEG